MPPPGAPELDLTEVWLDSDLAVIPEMRPHGLVNVGDEPVKVVGFFCQPEIISTFDEPVRPVGRAVLNQGAPVAV